MGREWGGGGVKKIFDMIANTPYIPGPRRLGFPGGRTPALVAELVDALVSGTSDSNIMEVRVLFRAPSTSFKPSSEVR